MSRFFSCSLAATSLLLAACSATGSAVQDTSRYGPAKGESELTFAGNLNNQAIDGPGDNFNLNTLFLQVAGGYFLDDNQEIGGQINLLTFGTDGVNGGDFDGRQLGLYPYYRWNFRGEGRGWFYAGGQLGLSSVDSGSGSDSSFGFGVHGGYKHWLQPNMAVFVEPRINCTDLDIGDVIEFQTLFGLAITL